MIAKGSKDEDTARRHIALWQGLIGHWNNDADTFRRMGRGELPVSARLLDEADRTRDQVRQALELCDTLTDNLAPGHELRRELMQIATAFEALSESLAISAEQMAPRVETGKDVAALKYLVAELKRDAQLPA